MEFRITEINETNFKFKIINKKIKKSGSINSNNLKWVLGKKILTINLS